MASLKTVRARTKLLVDTRQAISGGSSMVQHQDELKVLNKEERQTLLKECLGKNFRIEIPVGDILALKADLGETWYTLRKLKRYVHVWYHIISVGMYM